MLRLTSGTRRAPLLPPVLILAAVVVLVALLVGCGGGHPAAAQYHCPMHPTYISDKPGDCPICGMKLVPIEKSESGGKTAAAKGLTATDGAGSPPAGGPASGSAPTPRHILHYRNPMDPTVTSPVPMKDPMGMDYAPVYSDETAPSAGAVAGYATVEAGSEGMKLAGVQTAVAVLGSLSRDLRAVGTVQADETRARMVHTKIAGWIEKLFVSFSGQYVRRGDPLLTIYSPELLATQEEFLRTREAAARFAGSDLPEVRRGGEELMAAARRRLELFDVPGRFIEALERTGKAQRTVTLPAPVTGFVTSKDTYEGAQIDPGTTLFTITDLSHVWVEAEIYEYEAAAVQVGQEATITLPYDEGSALAGRVSLIYPTLNTDTRTIRVRFDFDNPGQTLKPGMYVNVRLGIGAGQGVLIPDSAILDTGVRQVVFVEMGPGRFEPREVKVGLRSDGRARILSGVAAGERVVVRANFLIDSESRLRAAIAGATTPDTAGAPR